MNAKQKLFCAITGYDVHGITGAKNDYYFDECKMAEEKFTQLKAYAENALDISMCDESIEDVYHAIKNMLAGVDSFFIYKELSKLACEWRDPAQIGADEEI